MGMEDKKEFQIGFIEMKYMKADEKHTGWD